MLVDKLNRKSELIEAVALRAFELLADDRGELAAAFVRRFYADVPPNDLIEDTVENLCGAALSMWLFGQERAAGEPKIRLYNPRLEDHGWSSPHTVVEMINDDMPFLVDSVAGALNRIDTRVRLVIHPIMRCRRDQRGGLVDLLDELPAATSESWMHIEIDEQGVAHHDEVRDRLEGVVEDVRVTVADWSAMKQRCCELVGELEESPPPIDEEQLFEGLEFLRWVCADHFTFLGAREYRFQGRGAKAVARILPESGLGLLRREEFIVFDGLRHLGRLPREVRHFVRQQELLRITKGNRRATVHRPSVFLDTIAVKRFGDDGKVTGERLFIGLFTSVAYSASVHEIPILRQRVARTLERSGFEANSHDGRTLIHILETYPRDELFQITEEELLEQAIDILHLQERQQIALFVRRDRFERFVSCLVYVPRDLYDTALRVKLQELIAAAYHGSVRAFYTHLTDAPLARIHIIVKTTPGKVPEVDAAALETRLIEAGRSWNARLERLLIDKLGEERGIRSARRFARAFPPSYRDHCDEHAAMLDIASIEEAIESSELAMRLYRPVGTPPSELHLKMFTVGRSVPLSDVMPMLENMGLQVLDEVPFDLKPKALEQRIGIRDFHLLSEAEDEIDLASVRDTFDDAFGRVWRGELANDGFNRLVLRAGLDAREVTVLRAYGRYLHQVGAPFSQSYVEQTLAGDPALTRRLVDLFLARFEPAVEGEAGGADEGGADEGGADEGRADEGGADEGRADEGRADEGRAGEEERLGAEIDELLERVESLDQDRIFRRFRNLIKATVRTNFFQLGDDGEPKPYLSLKLDSTRIEELPNPRPCREIFVYSPRVEAVHLRGGRVARGGIRWSDRHEDFRTEILGLMKAQMTKNAVIVPVGAKGGFVVKQPPGGRGAAGRGTGEPTLLDEVRQCYRTMICGLLDLTDNLERGRVVPPPRVVRHDADDPYLVVAADKGTATFSDIANEVAKEYGFWLDDAFASGGSAGYDHKKMGITARGAWESVKRHFRELGKDIDQQDFTVVGVGDMAGDVFGNGMLLSSHIRLLAAFNHRHIFVDPDPDPERSFAERRRLFELPGSSWADYDPESISPGGAVFDRQAKQLQLSPQVVERFDLAADEVTPGDLIRALLRGPAELLWFGGIGTFVKSGDESHLDVGDRANDSVRVDAAELRSQVVGEGANLGMTQLARIEYARAGGRLNTDFLDNSAGVGTSDREVNIKILLGEVERSGDMTRKQRNELLAEMEEEVAELVLRENYLQTQTLTVTHQLGARLLDRLARVMRGFERRQRLDRRIEFLPDDEELEERMKRREGFTRPELAVLLSYAKNELYDELLASELPDDPYLEADLIRYFPTPLRRELGPQIVRHRLRREIITSAIANEMLNRTGLAFVGEVQETTSQRASDIARAYVISREIFDLEALWRAIEELDTRVPASVQAAMLVDCGRLVERSTIWFLREVAPPLDVGRVIKAYGEGVRQLATGLAALISEEARESLERHAAAYLKEGVPEEVARMVATLPLLVPACDVVRTTRRSRLSLERVGKLFFDVGSRFGFDWLRQAAGRLSADSVWDKLAVSALVDDLFAQQSELATGILQATDGSKDPLATWTEAHQPLVSRTDQLLAELKSLGSPELSMLAVANRQLKAMIHSTRPNGNGGPGPGAG